MGRGDWFFTRVLFPLFPITGANLWANGSRVVGGGKVVKISPRPA